MVRLTHPLTETTGIDPSSPVGRDRCVLGTGRTEWPPCRYEPVSTGERDLTVRTPITRIKADQRGSFVPHGEIDSPAHGNDLHRSEFTRGKAVQSVKDRSNSVTAMPV